MDLGYDGEPSLQFAINLDFEDVSVQEPPQPRHHHPQHPSANLQSGMRRRKGPAKLAKNRKRAADFQAAKAAASAAAVTSFPGVGRAVGTGTGPTLPLPLSKGDYFPPPPTTSVCTTLTSSSTTTTSTTTSNTTTAHSGFKRLELIHLAFGLGPNKTYYMANCELRKEENEMFYGLNLEKIEFQNYLLIQTFYYNMEIRCPSQC